MADHSLAMSALRVAVYAPRDDEMKALARELAAARRANEELRREMERARMTVEDLRVRSVSPYGTYHMTTDPLYRRISWREFAEGRVDYINERTNVLETAAERLQHWALVQFANRLPAAVLHAIEVMEGADSDSETDDDVEMEGGTDSEADDDAEIAAQ